MSTQHSKFSWHKWIRLHKAAHPGSAFWIRFDEVLRVEEASDMDPKFAHAALYTKENRYVVRETVQGIMNLVKDKP